MRSVGMMHDPSNVSLRNLYEHKLLYNLITPLPAPAVPRTTHSEQDSASPGLPARLCDFPDNFASRAAKSLCAARFETRSQSSAIKFY